VLPSFNFLVPLRLEGKINSYSLSSSLSPSGLLEISLSILAIAVILVLRRKRIQAKLQWEKDKKEENKKIIMQI
jgi:hypothetical protein